MLSAGTVAGHWTVQRFVGNNAWHCKCACGTEKVVDGSALRQGRSTNCGCQRGTHRMSGTPEYDTWNGMIQRCTNPTQPFYEDYGGRGIKVCERWLKFENFYADMGPRPAGMTLERDRVNGDYEPGNCRWATQKEQQNNKRNSIRVLHEGREWTVSDLAAHLGFKTSTVYAYIRQGKLVKK